MSDLATAIKGYIDMLHVGVILMWQGLLDALNITQKYKGDE